MHELALYGQVPKVDHYRMIQQLAGFTRMQPREVTEIHVVLKARQPIGLDLLQSGGASGQGNQQQQDLQRVKSLLNAGLYYVRLVGEVATNRKFKTPANGDVAMTDSSTVSKAVSAKVSWTLEFKDTPEAGKQPVSSRVISRIPLEEGNLARFLNEFGYEYVSRYLVLGSRFFDNDTTILVHKVVRLPEAPAAEAISDTSFLENLEDMTDLDVAGGYIVQTSVDLVDGNNAELKERGTRQLLAMKESLKQAIDLTPGDRLGLDTRLPVSRRT